MTERKPREEEVWAQLTELKRLHRLMSIQNLTQRELAAAIGLRSHSYLGRLLRGDACTLDLRPAALMSKRLGVGFDDLFMVRTSSENRRYDKEQAA